MVGGFYFETFFRVAHSLSGESHMCLCKDWSLPSCFAAGLEIKDTILPFIDQNTGMIGLSTILKTQSIYYYT